MATGSPKPGWAPVIPPRASAASHLTEGGEEEPEPEPCPQIAVRNPAFRKLSMAVRMGHAKSDEQFDHAAAAAAAAKACANFQGASSASMAASVMFFCAPIASRVRFSAAASLACRVRRSCLALSAALVALPFLAHTRCTV